MSDNPFDSPRILIDEAKEHIARLEEGVKAFTHQDNWACIVDKDPETGEYLWKAEFKTDVPARLSAKVYGAAGCLRSALDHAAYASAVLTSGLDDPGRTKFPFGDTVDDLKGEIRRGKCDDMHEDVVAFVLALEPHQTGNVSLWALNKMRNKSDHRVLMPCAAGAGGFGLGNGKFNGTFSTMSEWRSTRRQLTFARLSADSQFNIDVSPTLNVVLNPALRFPGTDVCKVFNDLASEVDRIVTGIEAETVRILHERS